MKYHSSAGWRERCVRSIRTQDGSILIETALVLPVFCMVIFAIFGFSLVMLGLNSATYGAREAARYASLHSQSSALPLDCDGSTGAGCAPLTNIVQPLILGAAPGGLKVTPTYSGGNAVGGVVTVTVSVKYSMLVPFSNLAPITVGSSARHVITR